MRIHMLMGAISLASAADAVLALGHQAIMGSDAAKRPKLPPVVMAYCSI